MGALLALAGVLFGAAIACGAAWWHDRRRAARPYTATTYADTTLDAVNRHYTNLATRRRHRAAQRRTH